jgi:hypothetical protein
MQDEIHRLFKLGENVHPASAATTSGTTQIWGSRETARAVIHLVVIESASPIRGAPAPTPRSRRWRRSGWDLASIDLVDPRSGEHLATLLPIDKARNAERVRRVLTPADASEPARRIGTALRCPTGANCILADGFSGQATEVTKWSSLSASLGGRFRPSASSGTNVLVDRGRSPAGRRRLDGRVERCADRMDGGASSGPRRSSALGGP